MIEFTASTLYLKKTPRWTSRYDARLLTQGRGIESKSRRPHFHGGDILEARVPIDLGAR